MQSRRTAARSWLWFFLLLALAGIVAVVIPIVFNLRQQLQPEQLDAARARWKEKGPRDYDLLYQAKQDRAPKPDEYMVIVRDGQVWAVYVNRDVWLAKELALPLGGAVGPTIGAVAVETFPQRELTGYTVEGLFRTIDLNLHKNAEASGRNFATASFDVRDGHPIRYIYRDKGKSERLEWNIRLLRP